MLDQPLSLMHSGGFVMWPLLALSLIAVTLIVERCWFWLCTYGPKQRRFISELGAMLRRGDVDMARRLSASDAGVYGCAVRLLLSEGVSDATAIEAVESQRSRLERFMPTLSTIITAAPMLGILGTVVGIITSFQVLSDQATVTDPRLVSEGIAQALVSTAAGLLVAIVVLLPYNAFRAQTDRTLGRLEALIAAAEAACRKAA